ncbi:hypothetical protein JCM19237_2299 [Photobacterium aphoticum]|uniref:Secreted protein n=1 Tax=Photobacterium aphoticum TaxID=754436 RepID=A0A090QPH5_9GAMM|nr:hypothetical protein JCM19237_2299 [Photobacterium aphoticum]
MKPSLLTLLIALPALANEQAHVQLLDSQVSVTVNPPQTYSGYDETPIWKILEKEGWQAAQQAASNQDVSDKLVGEIDYQSTLNALTEKVKNRQTAQASALINAHPEWNTCDRIQWAWLVLQAETNGIRPECQTKADSTAPILSGACAGNHAENPELDAFTQRAGYFGQIPPEQWL